MSRQHRRPATPELAIEVPALPRAGRLSDPADVLAARRLYVSTHLRVGYIEPRAVAADGTLQPWADPFAAHSRYFGSFDADGVIRAACRLISNTAPQPVPTLQVPSLEPATRLALAGIEPGRLAEIASLARDGDAGTEHVRAVFRAMWLDALDRGETTWVLNVDALVLRSLRQMDADIFTVLGPMSPAPVRPVFPVQVRVRDVYDAMFTNNLRLRAVVLA